MRANIFESMLQVLQVKDCVCVLLSFLVSVVHMLRKRHQWGQRSGILIHVTTPCHVRSTKYEKPKKKCGMQMSIFDGADALIYDTHYSHNFTDIAFLFCIRICERWNQPFFIAVFFRFTSRCISPRKVPVVTDLQAEKQNYKSNYFPSWFRIFFTMCPNLSIAVFDLLFSSAVNLSLGNTNTNVQQRTHQRRHWPVVFCRFQIWKF